MRIALLLHVSMPVRAVWRRGWHVSACKAGDEIRRESRSNDAVPCTEESLNLREPRHWHVPIRPVTPSCCRGRAASGNVSGLHA